jgi:hypothetical protein
MEKRTPTIVPIILSAFLIVATLFTLPTALTPEDSSDAQVIRYGSNVCVTTTGDFEGRSTPSGQGLFETVQCESNLVVNAGLDAIMTSIIAGGAVDGFDFIGICNATVGAGCSVPAAGDTTLGNEYGSSGLHRQQGTFSSLGTGNYTIYNTFTANSTGGTLGAGHITNSTGLFNASTSGTLLAENTFTLVTLQQDDQLTVNWTIFVVSG